jgi:hypothetical protein
MYDEIKINTLSHRRQYNILQWIQRSLINLKSRNVKRLPM